jgi:hypothetical protein
MRWRLLTLAAPGWAAGPHAVVGRSAGPRLPRNVAACGSAWPDGRDRGEEAESRRVRAGGEVERGSFAAGHPHLRRCVPSPVVDAARWGLPPAVSGFSAC